MKIIYHFISNLVEKFPAIKSSIVKAWYESFSKMDKNGNILCMNYGYAHLDDKEIDLNNEDESHRYSLQLYERTVSSVDLKDREVLEIGSGRGGGASFLKRYFKPRKLLGVDFSKTATKFCNHQHRKISGLNFMKGNAEALNLENDSFDVIVNIESSLHYPNVEKFLYEAFRVLRNGAYFLWADIRQAEEIKTWREQVKKSGFKIIEEELITENVLKALEKDEERKLQLMMAHTPKIIHPSIREFAGLKGSKCFQDFVEGKLEYWRFVMQKI